MGQSFRGPEICRLTGITYRKLDYWARNDVVRPSIAEANGSGSLRRYSYEDAVLLAVVANLIDAGVSLYSARVCVNALRRGNQPAAVALVLDGGVVTLAHTSRDLAATIEHGSRVTTVVILAAVRAALDEAIDEANAGGPRVRLAG